MERLIAICLRYRFLVIAFAVLLVIAGVTAMYRLPIDAVPDITPVQVQILTKSPALGPVEVEQYITFPVESAMTGIPGVKQIRSLSRYGLSAVTVIFEDGVSLPLARQFVSERLNTANENIPEGYGHPEIGPMTTGLSEVFMFTVEGEGYTPMQLRTILDWDIMFRLRSVPGIVEVNTQGGYAKQYQVVVDPNKLIAYKLSLRDVFEALQGNNANTGSGYIEHNQEQYIIRGEALAKSIADLENTVIVTREGGVPVFVRNIAEVREGAMMRIGAATENGRGETVVGVTMMLAGENANQVVARVKNKIAEIQPTLPKGVRIVPFYDRASFVDRVLHTVRKNLLEGGLLVVAVLLLLLGNLRGGLIVASAIPLAMMVAFIGMLMAGVSGNLMSLGAIDFGIIVDGSVVMIENITRRLHRGREPGTHKSRLERVREAATEVVRPVVFAVLIIVLVYFPILSLTGVEGKMFRPMAITVIFALLGSLVLATTLMPVLASLFLRESHEKDTWLMRKARRLYEPSLDWAMRNTRKVAAVALGLFFLSVVLFLFIGREFIPRLDEGDILLQPVRLPSISLSESIKNATRIEHVVKQFSEVKTVVTRTGTAEIATDVMGIESADMFVILKPRSEWKHNKSREQLIAEMNEALEKEVPGVGFSFTQPIEMRFNELIAGVRSDIAVKLFGDDLTTLREKGEQIATVLKTVKGAADVRLEQTAGLPVIRASIDRARLARYGLTAQEVLTVIEASRVGKVVGTIFEGQRRFTLSVRMPESAVADPDAFANLPIAMHNGRVVPLSQVADVKVEVGPAQVSRENVQRRITIEANIRGRDLGSFIAEAQQKIGAKVSVPPGYHIEWGGQFEQLREATHRLAIVVPLTMALIFLLLYTAFGSWRPAALIFLNVPLAITGGLFALEIRGLPFSISAAVGFIALFGVAVLNGVVLVSYIIQLRQEGKSVEEAVTEGAKTRLRPVLMTALVASLGFVPMALSTGVGAEVQRPLATVVIGGLVTSTLLTLLVLPTIYRWFEERREEAEL
ncbi:MAG TPA: CusA/CzcA family heavy metal efflux RND transporter [Candidatus Saccharimonadales bacterium]|nr:CusA/CzcA family heavy metal efflux RND transporter [Candidatus Saccharimonadales bacterium]